VSSGTGGGTEPYLRAIDAAGNPGPMETWGSSGADHMVSLAAVPGGTIATLVWTGPGTTNVPQALTVAKATW